MKGEQALGPTVRLLMSLTPEQVLRVYSGRPGCGCGCRGNYSDAKAAKTRALNVLRNAPVSEVKVSAGMNGEGLILVWETESRYRWVYLKEGVA
jgi:hypothetical protein